MPRTYTPKNRYCRNTKLSEQEFLTALSGFTGGVGAAAVARDMERSERSIRTLFGRFRRRFMEDEKLTGWFCRASDLPDTDDPVWPALHHCMFHCEAYIPDKIYTSPHYVTEFRNIDPNADHRQRVARFTRSKHGTKCRSCPVLLDFEFDVQVREVWGKHDLRVGGVPRDNFKPHFFEIMLRAAWSIKNDKFQLPEGYNLDYIVACFEKEPL
ncbi:hypothetical protein [Pacificibacter sp. AS14]|uniref:hypothetical protein n=1 Tax=Pacificibacter sp. AS14 TaxID=3135785 RepID=UPI0031779DDE